MNILITGAAGTVGFATIDALLRINPDFKITATDLPQTIGKLNKYRELVDIQLGNIADLNFVTKLAENKDFVIHLAAIIPPLADQKFYLADRVNIDGTKNLISAIEQKSPNAMFIYSSSISVYGDRLQNPHIKVGDALIPSEGDHYAETKIEAEKAIQNSLLQWSIFRLTAVFGVKNHKVSKFMFHMPLETPMEIITPQDAGRAFAKAVMNKDAINGKIFNLSGGEKCRIYYKRFLEKSFSIFGLGDFKFPTIAFATRNFHCAYYEDGYKLEDILHFRNDTIDSYFYLLRMNTSPIERFFNMIASPIVKLALLAASEPYNAIKTGNTKAIKRYFGANNLTANV